MKIKPCKQNLLVKFYQPESALVVAPSQRLASGGEHRTRVKVIEPSKELEAEFPAGTFLLLRPSPAILVISEPLALGLITSDVVEAIVLDDEEPIEVNPSAN